MLRFARFLLLAVFSTGFANLTSCVSWLAPSTEIPLRTLRHQPLGPTSATGLLVLMPGMGDRAERFVEQGVVAMVRELAPDFDVIAADAHFGYYHERILMERLEQDVIGPALAAGYRQVWLLGVSLGGLGAANYASSHPGQITGVLLLAPYLGGGPVARSLMAAPRLADWDPTSVVDDSELGGIMIGVWSWLQTQTGPHPTSAVLLGYGNSDGPRTIDERLATALPPEHFAQVPGGHDWKVWLSLLHELLPRMASAADRM